MSIAYISTVFCKTLVIHVLLSRGPTKHCKRLKHRKGTTKDLLNTAKYDKGPDNPKLNPNLKSFVILCYGMILSPLSFFAVFSRSI